MTNNTKWLINKEQSKISFNVNHLIFSSIKGVFNIFDADISTTAKDFNTSKINLWVDASSITTGDIKRDEHLKSADFFDVRNHKEIIFTSNSVSKPDATGNRELAGELIIKGISKTVKLNVQHDELLKDLLGNERALFTVTGKINRLDWGLIWNGAIETGGLMESAEVNVLCEIELVNAVQKNIAKEPGYIVQKNS